MTTSTTSSAPYTAALCKGSGLLAETKALLRAWRPGESTTSLRDRVLHEDILGRSTAHRVNDLVSKVFGARFLRPDDRPARDLRRLLECPRTASAFSDMCLIFAARHDAVLRDALVKVYWPAVRRKRLVIKPEEIAALISDAEANGRIENAWSLEVKGRVVSGALRALVDFGLLRGLRRGPREVVHYQPSDVVVIYLAHDLHFAGVSDGALVTHEDWALLGFGPTEVTAALDRLTANGWWIIQAAGSVVRMTWKYVSLEAVVDALTR